MKRKEAEGPNSAVCRHSDAGVWLCSSWVGTQSQCYSAPWGGGWGGGASLYLLLHRDILHQAPPAHTACAGRSAHNLYLCKSGNLPKISKVVDCAVKYPLWLTVVDGQDGAGVWTIVCALICGLASSFQPEGRAHPKDHLLNLRGRRIINRTGEKKVKFCHVSLC